LPDKFNPVKVPTLVIFGCALAVTLTALVESVAVLAVFA